MPLTLLIELHGWRGLSCAHDRAGWLLCAGWVTLAAISGSLLSRLSALRQTMTGAP